MRLVQECWNPINIFRVKKKKLRYKSTLFMSYNLSNVLLAYLFKQRVSADFFHPDLPRVQLSHILIHDGLQVHGTVEATLQLPEQRCQSPGQEARLSTAACGSTSQTLHLLSKHSAGQMSIEGSINAYPTFHKAASTQTKPNHSFLLMCLGLFLPCMV